jgi:hypothetical protein
MSTFESDFLKACAPTVLGVKDGTLFSCPKEDIIKLNKINDKYSVLLLEKDIYIKPLYQCNNRQFILAYRKKKLEETLHNKKISAFLKKTGYPVDNNMDMEKMLDFLAVRIMANNSFPHEIGFFLGYPQEDVFGFIKNKGTNYKLCGYWKVYGNVEKARSLFESIAMCSENMKSIILSQKSFPLIINAA